MPDNSLSDRPKNWRCPECGHDRIVITARTCARIEIVDGEVVKVDADEGEPYWYPSDYARCGCSEVIEDEEEDEEEECDCEWDETVADLEVAE